LPYRFDPINSKYNHLIIIIMKTFKLFLVAIFMLLAGISFSQTWSYVNSTGTTFILYGMSFPPGQSNIGFACGMQYTYDADGVIVKTTDGGDNWTQIWPVSGTIDGLQGIWFTSNLVGFACGWNNYFIKTTDGGATWTPVTVGSDVWYYVDVEFWDANNGIALAKMNNPETEQAAFITSNGGTSWVPATSGLATAEIMGLSYATQNNVYVVGTGAHVFKSTDGGHNWTTISTLSAMLFGVDFASNTFGVVGGEEKMFATNNGGSSWTTYTTGYENFYATKAFTNGTAYIGGTDENIYITTDYGTTWTAQNGGPGSSTLYRIRFTDNNTGFACGSGGTIMKLAPVLTADFTASNTTVCAGGTVNFYDNSEGDIDSWSWTFEGGNPSTSTVPNPVVAYSTPGTYDVELTVTSGSNSDTELKTNFISVITTPSQPNTPAGPSSVCGEGSYPYSTQAVQYADSYFWTVNPTSAGTMTGNGTVGTFMASNTWEGTYTIKVRAENECGNGPWSPDFTGTLWHNPVTYSFIGDGAYCEGEPGFEIILDGSETGVSYELYKDNVSTGTIVAGTGDSLNFGLFTETGLYRAVGFTVHCTQNMLGEVYVHQQPLPGQAAMPGGPNNVCAPDTSEYMTYGAPDADDYSWTLSPPEAGVLTPNGDEASIAWNSGFSGFANLTVTGINDCGAGTPSDELIIGINATPDPSVSGPGIVCNNQEADYSTAEHIASIYTWEVTGGTITAGAGTWQITVHWGSPGTGHVTVNEMTNWGCDGDSETLDVNIDDCTGIGEGTAETVRIYPNPASDKVQVMNLEDATIRIFNLLGSEIKTIFHADGNKAMDMSPFDKGIYFVKVEQGSGVEVFRLVKN
jgi:photosystem II stability/assembly factor-like uncharacterized protein